MTALNNNDDDKTGHDWERRPEEEGQIEGVKGEGERKKEQGEKTDWKNLYIPKAIIYVTYLPVITTVYILLKYETSNQEYCSVLMYIVPLATSSIREVFCSSMTEGWITPLFFTT